jgi:hypothetical protein
MSEIFKQRRNGEELARCSAQVGGSGTTHPCQHAALQPPFRERCRDHIFHTPSSPLFQLAACVTSAAEASKGIECTKCQFSCTQTTVFEVHTHGAAHQPPHLPQPSHVQLDPPHTHLYPSKSDPRASPTAAGSIDHHCCHSHTRTSHAYTFRTFVVPARPCPHTNLTHSRGRCSSHEHIHLTASQPAFCVT